jgi:hypothetical protein
VLGAIAVQVGAFRILKVEAAGLPAAQAHVDSSIAVGLVSSADQRTLGQQVGYLLLLEVQQVLA